MVNEITIYNWPERGVVGVTKTTNHENGHRQARQLPNAKGGWGSNLTYVWAKDGDGDFVHDEYEAANPDDQFTPGNRDDAARDAWDHAAYGQATGKGLCTKNEADAQAKAAELQQVDWSSTGSRKGK